MPQPLLMEHYASERAQLESQINAIHSIAFSREDKNFSDDERTQLATLTTGMERLNRSIESAAEVDRLSQQARAALDRGQVRGDFTGHEYATEGEVIYDLWHRGQDPAADYRYTQHLNRAAQRVGGGQTMDRAAQHMGTKAGDTVSVAGGFDALIVTQVQGPVIRLFPVDTPMLSLIGARPSPTPMTFMRPRIVDPDFYTAAGEQAGGKQKGELPSKKWDYAADPVSLATIGNYINLSYQAIEWIPSALNDVIDHLRLRTEAGLERRVVAEVDRTGNTIPLADDADAAATQAAVWDAMAAVFQATNRPAEWIAGGPLGLAMLGKKVDLAGRPMFPITGATNALGTAQGFGILNPFGLTFGLTFGIPDTTLYVGNSLGMEAYVYRFPILDAVEPSVLGRQIAAAAGIGFFHPTTKEEVTGTGAAPAEHNAIVKIGS